MITINIQVAGVDTTTARFNRIINALSNWQPELQQAGDFLKQFYSVAGFATRGAVFGAPWAPLSPAYEFYKRKMYPGAGILVRSGTMQGGFRVMVKGNSMELTNVAGYAKYHQSDEPRKSNLPQRKIAKLDDPRQKEIVNIFKQGIVKKIKDSL